MNSCLQIIKTQERLLDGLESCIGFYFLELITVLRPKHGFAEHTFGVKADGTLGVLASTPVANVLNMVPSTSLTSKE